MRGKVVVASVSRASQVVGPVAADAFVHEAAAAEVVVAAYALRPLSDDAGILGNPNTEARSTTACRPSAPWPAATSRACHASTTKIIPSRNRGFMYRMRSSSAPQSVFPFNFPVIFTE